MTTWRWSKEIQTKLDLYLVENIPYKERNTNRRVHTGGNPELTSEKKRRRAEYARVQDLWKKNPSRCVKRILEDQLGHEDGVPKETMVPFWKAVFKGTEIASTLLPLNTASGLYDVEAKTLRLMPTGILDRIFNLFMWCRELPEE